MAKVFEARWVGPGPQRRDGPEHQIFRRNMWLRVTSEATAYFRQFPKVWETREIITVRKKRGRPRKKAVPKPVVVSQSEKVAESESGLGGSAIEEESSDSGFVAVPVDREEGSGSEPAA